MLQCNEWLFYVLRDKLMACTKLLFGKLDENFLYIYITTKGIILFILIILHKIFSFINFHYIVFLGRIFIACFWFLVDFLKMITTYVCCLKIFIDVKYKIIYYTVIFDIGWKQLVN